MIVALIYELGVVCIARVWCHVPKQLNALLEVVDSEIANIIELEKARQWKNPYVRNVLKRFGWILQCGETDTKKISAVSILFETMPYRLNESTGYIDYDQVLWPFSCRKYRKFSKLHAVNCIMVVWWSV
ncbi:unnamed protein product [Ilex paraguariensis]|uniref:Serine hydroxymethyltransferase-like domain-containing protein n=1 Tax=Ilex paraguariensis TaxID=185542 RepID=A0ABC8SXD2_9AQUA